MHKPEFLNPGFSSISSNFDTVLVLLRNKDYSMLIARHTSHMPEGVTASKEQQSRHSASSRVVLFCSLHAVTSVIYITLHTHVRTYGKM